MKVLNSDCQAQMTEGTALPVRTQVQYLVAAITNRGKLAIVSWSGIESREEAASQMAAEEEKSAKGWMPNHDFHIRVWLPEHEYMQDAITEQEYAAMQPVQEETTAETILVRLDECQDELENATSFEQFESCKVQMVELKAQIVALGYDVERCVTGWQLVTVVVEEVAAPASSQVTEQKEIIFISYDENGLYAAVKSGKGTGTYTVRICSRWLQSRSCDCHAGQHGRDCKHRLLIDRAFDGIRPTFSDQCEGVVVSRSLISSLIANSTARAAA